MARARLTIDLDAIAANWRALDARSGRGVETAAVVKADAYGLGMDRVAPALAAAGARSFFVGLAEEGVRLRAILGPDPEISVLSGPLPGDAAAMRAAALIPCLNSLAQVTCFAGKMPDCAFAVQLDSGMNRLGLEPGEIDAACRRLGPLAPSLVLSHLACADMPDHPLNPRQRASFAAMAAHWPGARRSLAATGGVLLGEAFHFDLARVGIGLFGGLPFAQARPVLRLALPVIQVRDVAPGEAVGYGADWVASRPARIATVAAGYGDGLPRALGRGGAALFAGARRCPLVGRVSMDLIAADVSALGAVPEELEILGPHQGIDDLAAAAGTIGYEILTGLGGRYDRVYKGGPAGPDPA